MSDQAPSTIRMSRSRLVLGLVGWLVLAFTAAAAGAIASVNAREFYAQLVRPTWAPPGAVFGPVWSVLYTLMGVAAWLVWKERGAAAAKGALSMFVAQLVANALWSWLFFAWHKGTVALVDLALLWIVVLIVIMRFFRVSKVAAALLVPYLMWLSFAGALNYAVVQRNPAQLAVLH